MMRKIPKISLKVGMYVVQYGSGSKDDPYVLIDQVISSPKQIRDIVPEAITEVMIDDEFDYQEYLAEKKLEKEAEELRKREVEERKRKFEEERKRKLFEEERKIEAARKEREERIRAEKESELAKNKAKEKKERERIAKERAEIKRLEEERKARENKEKKRLEAEKQAKLRKQEEARRIELERKLAEEEAKRKEEKIRIEREKEKEKLEKKKKRLEELRQAEEDKLRQEAEKRAAEEKERKEIEEKKRREEILKRQYYEKIEQEKQKKAQEEQVRIAKMQQEREQKEKEEREKAARKALEEAKKQVEKREKERKERERLAQIKEQKELELARKLEIEKQQEIEKQKKIEQERKLEIERQQVLARKKAQEIAEKKRQEKAKLAKIQAEKETEEARKRENERLERERKEAERLEKEQLEAEELEAEKRKFRVELERMEAEKRKLQQEKLDSKKAKRKVGKYKRDQKESLKTSIIKENVKKFRHDLFKIRDIYGEAVEFYRNLSDTVRKGETPDHRDGLPLVEMLVDGVCRNQDAACSVCKLRNVNEYIYTHGVNVAMLAVILGKRLGMDLEQLRDIGLAGMYHDVGMHRMPQNILNKPGPLSNSEFTMMKQHPLVANLLLKDQGMPVNVLRAILEHHERFDGHGYPEQLKGDQFGPYSSIISIADVYDALTSNRIYKKALPSSQVLGMMYQWRNTEFPQELVEHFIKFVGVYPVGSLVKLSDNTYAVVLSVDSKTTLRPVVRRVLDNKFRPIEAETVDLSVQKDHENRLEIMEYIDPSIKKIDVLSLMGEG